MNNLNVLYFYIETMLNTIPLKKPEINLKPPTHLENIENIINVHPDNNWSHEERSNLLIGKDNKNGNIIKPFHEQFNNIGNKPEIKKLISSNVNDNNLNNNLDNNHDKIMISFSKKLKKFTIYDNNKNVIGYFTTSHIIKYLGKVYDTDRQFMNDINLETFKKAKELIKLYVFKIDYNKKNKKSDIIIHDYTESGLMGDISLLIELNNLLIEYQEKELYRDLANVNEHNKVKIEQNIKKFIYLLLNYTIKLIFIISEKIKDSPKMTDLKNVLLKYAITCSHRINLFVQEQLSVIYVCDKEIKKAYVTNMEIKNIIKNKLEDITKNVVNEYKSDRIVYNGGDALKL